MLDIVLAIAILVLIANASLLIVTWDMQWDIFVIGSVLLAGIVYFDVHSLLNIDTAKYVAVSYVLAMIVTRCVAASQNSSYSTDKRGDR